MDLGIWLRFAWGVVMGLQKPKPTQTERHGNPGGTPVGGRRLKGGGRAEGENAGRGRFTKREHDSKLMSRKTKAGGEIKGSMRRRDDSYEGPGGRSRAAGGGRAGAW